VSNRNPEALRRIGSRLNTHSQNLSKGGFAQSKDSAFDEQNFIFK